MKTLSLYKETLAVALSSYSFSSKKKGKTVLHFILIGLLLLIGFGPMTFMFTKNLVNFSYSFGPEKVYSVIITSAYNLVILFGIVNIYSILYHSTDIKNLIYLPIKSKTIYRARILQNLTTIAPFLLLLVFETIYVFVVCKQYLWLPKTLIALVFTIILATSVSSLICFIIRKIFKNNNSIKTILSIFAIVLFSLAIIFLDNQKVNLDQVNSILKYFSILTITSKSIIYLLLYIAFSIGFYFAIEYLVSKNLLKDFSVYNSIKTKRKFKKEKASNSLFISLFKREFDIINSEKIFASQIYLSSFIPVILILALVFNKEFMNLGVIATITYSVLIAFINPANALCCIIFSREGKTFRILKSLPINVKTYLYAKQAVSIVFSFTISYVCIIVFAILTKTSVLFTLLTILMYSLLNLSVINIELTIDSVKPNFNWTNAQILQKRNAKAFISYCVTIVLFAIAILPVFILAYCFSVTYMFAILVDIILLVIILVITQIVYFKKGKNIFSLV